MHIAIDKTPLQTGHSVRGVGQYTKLLIESLQKYETQHSFSFFVRGEKVPKNADIVHYPYFEPFFLTLPLIKALPTVVTVHDLIPLEYPENFPKGIKGFVKWQIQKWSIQGVRLIITDSYASKQSILRLIKIPEKNIHVVPLAASPSFTHVGDMKLLMRVKKKFSLPDQFFLYVGDVNWNKNILGLVSAFIRLRAHQALTNGKTAKLVLVGKAFHESSLPELRKLQSAIAQNNLENTVVMLGYVSDSELSAVYRLSTASVQPSFAEGFGFPVLEAMACGAPVVCAKGSSLDEIAGPSIRVHPSDTDDIARGMKEALELTNAQRKHLVDKQLAWQATYSWRRVGRETVKAYEAVG